MREPPSSAGPYLISDIIPDTSLRPVKAIPMLDTSIASGAMRTAYREPGESEKSAEARKIELGRRGVQLAPITGSISAEASSLP